MRRRPAAKIAAVVADQDRVAEVVRAGDRRLVAARFRAAHYRVIERTDRTLGAHAGSAVGCFRCRGAGRFGP